MREEHLESLPAVQIDATLFFGKDPIHCYIVSVTDTGFCVAVPDVEQYEGDPCLILIVKDSTYPVKLIKQTAHAGGYSYVLQKMDGSVDTQTDPSLSDPTSAKPKSSSSSYNVVGTFAAMIAGVVFATTVGSQMPGFNLKTIGDGLTRTSVRITEVNAPVLQVPYAELTTPPVESPTAQIKPQPQDNIVSEVSMNSTKSNSNRTSVEPVTPESNREVEVRPPTKTVASAGNSQSRPSQQARQHHTNALNRLLDDHKIGQFRDMTKSDCPWLFDGNSFHGKTIRASDAARFDLKQFERGLQDLSADASSRAITSLGKTLTEAGSISQNTRRVPDTQNVYVISSDDANVYFRNTQDHMELIRVLPLEFDGDGRR